MTEEEYWAAVRWAGLTPTARPGVFLDKDGMPRSVPHPARFTPEQRAVIVEEFRAITRRIRGEGDP
jgi:hypothetical protein